MFKKRESEPRANSKILFTPLVGKFDFENPTTLGTPGPDDEYTKKLDELEAFYRQSERLRELA